MTDRGEGVAKKSRDEEVPKRLPATWANLRAASLRAATFLQVLVTSAERRDWALSEQLARATTHLVLSLSRANAHEGSAGRRHLLSAVASSSEAMILLRLVVDHRHCSWPRAKPAYDELSRLIHALLKRADLRRAGLLRSGSSRSGSSRSGSSRSGSSRSGSSRSGSSRSGSSRSGSIRQSSSRGDSRRAA